MEMWFEVYSDLERRIVVHAQILPGSKLARIIKVVDKRDGLEEHKVYVYANEFSKLGNYDEFIANVKDITKEEFMTYKELCNCVDDYMRSLVK